MAFDYGLTEAHRITDFVSTSGYPFSMSCWFYPTRDDPGVTEIIYGADDGVGLDIVVVNMSPSSNNVAAFITTDGVTIFDASSGTAANLDEWNFVSWYCTASEIGVSLNGQTFQTGPISISIPVNIANMEVGGILSGVLGLTGSVAHTTFWEDQITQAESDALALGMSPLFIRPDVLVSYRPLIRDTFDLVWGNSMSDVGTPDVVSGPAIYMPSSQILRYAPAAAAGGTEFEQSVAGVFAPVGVIGRSTTKIFIGSMLSAGAISRDTDKSVAGLIIPAGAVNKDTTKSFAGTLGLSGTLARVRTIVRLLAGALGFTGTTNKETAIAFGSSTTPISGLSISTAKSFAGSVTPAGATSKETQKGLAGVLGLSGTLSSIRTYLRLLTSTLGLSGGLVKDMAKGIAGALTPTGLMNRDMTKNFAGALTPTGLTNKETTKSFAGTLGLSGSLATIIVFLRTITASLTPSGGLVKSTFKNIIGNLIPDSEITKETRKSFAGSVAPVSATTKETQRDLAGSITPVGILESGSVFFRNLAGSLSFSGALTTLTGIITFVAEQINDVTMNVTGPQINEGKLAHYKSNGASSDALVDAEVEYLLARGISAGDVADMWETYLISKGFSGTLADMKRNWWDAGAPL